MEFQNPLNKRREARKFLDEAKEWAFDEIVFVTLPLSYKETWVDSSLGFKCPRTIMLRDGYRLYACNPSEALRFDEEFPTIACRPDPMETVTKLEALTR